MKRLTLDEFRASELTLTHAEEIAGSLSEPSKMPAFSYGLPAEECITGKKLVNVPGSVCENCYALKGFYAKYGYVIKPAQYKRLASITREDWVPAMVRLIDASCKRINVYFFRWHDSGDLQSVEHLRKIVAIAVYLPRVRFWLPTREYAIVAEYLRLGGQVPKNLVIRLSAHKIDGPAPDIAGLPVSSVYSEKVPRGARRCIAPDQNNECGDCYACWNSRVKHVSYHVH